MFPAGREGEICGGSTEDDPRARLPIGHIFTSSLRGRPGFAWKLMALGSSPPSTVSLGGILLGNLEQNPGI